MYFYSAKTNSFYPIELKQNYIASGSLPDDVIEVSLDIYQDYAANNAPEGKYRIAGQNGLPEWADIPPPTREELQQYIESKKQQFIVEASQQIAPLQDAVDLGIATQEEEAALLVWKKYRVMLNRIDISQAPDIEWPEQPK
ncbi:tail fiber assembly protein [Photorhabdus laumondii subsp. laumondii]|uniref:Tail fiber assembly protein n=2 Tax=Photorhabdus TaxID=29487 RepID=A0A6L9JJ79_PHOLM|nr:MULTISPECIES: tail fiber assembly protein [Photorhabdus]MCC8386365.1 tail fiber assembly protein [Photorhabdus laumondii]MCC8415743.1 tail fiber assembly protein [Photorhabdus laumondii]NDK94976.1 tail fiber assembly protein [Photorhabdus laumondii subsp. laumondii]NDL21270.1 tail fiber assembly protein [Photorhabdus laumondii subsp. laumondii]NDL30235.1 tail fiber assembly protein [Photorhabdus laumondii subsp. laumondii]